MWKESVEIWEGNGELLIPVNLSEVQRTRNLGAVLVSLLAAFGL